MKNPTRTANAVPVPPPACAAASGAISEDDIVALVHRFYANVREDAVLGPIFTRHVDDWDAHLALLVDFWSALLRGTRRFRGAPVTRHNALPGLDAALFERWLALFDATTTSLGHPLLKAEADAQARLIATRLWQRYRENAESGRDG